MATRKSSVAESEMQAEEVASDLPTTITFINPSQSPITWDRLGHTIGGGERRSNVTPDDLTWYLIGKRYLIRES